MNKKIKLALKIVSNSLSALVVILAFLLHGFPLFGLKPYSVLSGSMESVYPTGSLIYVGDVDPADLVVNDIITFRLPSGTVATHRIIEIIPDSENPSIHRFRTKGDKNEIPDDTLVEFGNVITVDGELTNDIGAVFENRYAELPVSPPTGDHTTVLWFVAMALSGIVCTFLIAYSRKKRTNK